MFTRYSAGSVARLNLSPPSTRISPFSREALGVTIYLGDEHSVLLYKTRYVCTQQCGYRLIGIHTEILLGRLTARALKLAVSGDMAVDISMYYTSLYRLPYCVCWYDLPGQICWYQTIHIVPGINSVVFPIKNKNINI